MDYWELIEKAFNAVNIYDREAEFRKGLDPLPAPVKHLLAAHWLQSEVNNSTGVLAPEAQSGFRAMGLTAVADIVAEAIAAFGPTYPRDADDRNAIRERLPGRTIERKSGSSFRRVHLFNALDDRCFKALPDFAVAVQEYAEAHAGAAG